MTELRPHDVSGLRGLVILTAVALVGCGVLPTPPPASFQDYVRTNHSAFSAATLPAGEMSADEAIATVRGERERHAAFRPTTPLSKTYLVIACPDAATCAQAFSVQHGATTMHVWLIWSQATTGPDAGRWLAVNAVTRFYAVGSD